VESRINEAFDLPKDPERVEAFGAPAIQGQDAVRPFGRRLGHPVWFHATTDSQSESDTTLTTALIDVPVLFLCGRWLKTDDLYRLGPLNGRTLIHSP
jgi:hypothetical protein